MASYDSYSFYRRVWARQDELDKERKLWDPQRQEIVEHFRPDLPVYGAEESSAETGTFLHQTMTEGTGAWAAQVMARGFQSAMVGPSLKWFRHVMRQIRLRGIDPINAWLQRFDDYLCEGVYRPSNFYEVIGQNVLDGITIGSPVMLIEQDYKRRCLQCKLPHYDQNYLMRDWFGEDIGYHRKFELNNLNAARRFGRKNLPPTIQDELKNGEHFKKHTYLQAVYDAGDPILRNFTDEPPPRPDGSNLMYRPLVVRPWVEFYFCRDSQGDARYEAALPAGVPGYHHKPFCAWHYWRNDHETYARTPAWYAIYDEKGGMSGWATMHDSAQLAASPAMIGLAAMKGRTGPHKVKAGRWTWAKTAEEYDRPPRPIVDNLRYPHAMEFVDRLDDKRKRHFHIDLFRMLDEYHREHKQPPTAFEIAQMLAEKNAQIGPAIESFDRGLLGPVDARIVEIEARSGRLFRETEPPEELLGMTLDDMMPVFTGPLAQAQKVAVTMRRVQDPLTMAAPIFDIWPDAKYKVKADVLTERILEDLDFYQDAIATEQEYNAIMDFLTRQRARQTALEEANLAAETVSKLAGKEPLKALGAA